MNGDNHAIVHNLEILDFEHRVAVLRHRAHHESHDLVLNGQSSK